MIKLLVCDMDNTLYSWVDYIVPSLEAMVDSLEKTTKLPKIEIIQSLKQVYGQYGTNEYPFAIQESSIFTRFNYDFNSFNKLIIEPARQAFSERRRKYLKLYPMVEKGLKGMREKIEHKVLLTDAPRNSAEMRVKELGLDKYFDALYCMPSYRFPHGKIDPQIEAKDREGLYRANIKVIELDPHWEKPDPRGLDQVLKDYEIKPQEAALIGDNLQKDIALAQKAGVIDIWAEYGTYVSLEYRERLEIISSDEEIKRNLVIEEKVEKIKPSYQISNFSLALDIITMLSGEDD